MAITRGYGPPVFAPRALLLWLVLSCFVGCGEAHDDATPTGALLMFLEAMDQAASDSNALERAYRLLDPAARAALTQRADKAETLAGHAYQPWEMLAEGRFRLRFAPARHRMRAKIDGDKARVSVSDENGKQSVYVPLVREGEAWRVVLEVPPMYQPAAQGT